MKRWITIAAVVLLGLWAACSVNCAFENLSRAESLTCCNDENGDSDRAPTSSSQCACSVLVSVACLPHSQAWLVALPADVVLSPFAFCDIDLSALSNCVVQEDAPPPELAGTWQFTVRTALPARAPSLVS